MRPVLMGFLLGVWPLMLAQAAENPAITEQALERLEGRLGLNPYDPVALNNLAVIRANEGNWIEALSLLERAQRFAVDHPVISRNVDELGRWLDTRLPEPPVEGLALRETEPLPPPPPLWAP